MQALLRALLGIWFILPRLNLPGGVCSRAQLVRLRQDVLLLASAVVTAPLGERALACSSSASYSHTVIVSTLSHACMRIFAFQFRTRPQSTHICPAERPGMSTVQYNVRSDAHVARLLLSAVSPAYLGSDVVVNPALCSCFRLASQTVSRQACVQVAGSAASSQCQVHNRHLR